MPSLDLCGGIPFLRKKRESGNRLSWSTENDGLRKAVDPVVCLHCVAAISSCALIMTDCVGYRLRDRSGVVSAILAFILTVSLPLLVLESRAPTISAVPFGMVVQLKLVAAVQIRRVAAHSDLVVLQIADARAAGVACLWCRVAVGIGVAAQLGADAEDVAEDVLEEGFEGRDCGGDEACVELRADPDCDSCTVVCMSGEHLWVGYSQSCMYLQVGLVVDPNRGSSVHLAMAQTVASKPIVNTPRRAHLLYTETLTFER
jgi:hypothetical protein